MATTYSLISTISASSGAVASFDFTSIPPAYDDLILKISARSTGSNVGLYVALNGSLSNQSRKLLYTDTGNSVSSYVDSTAAPGWTVNSGWTSNTFTNTELYFTNYANTSYNKRYYSDATTEQNATQNYAGLISMIWASTAAINRITVTSGASDLAQYSSASLYGIKKS